MGKLRISSKLVTQRVAEYQGAMIARYFGYRETKGDGFLDAPLWSLKEGLLSSARQLGEISVDRYDFEKHVEDVGVWCMMLWTQIENKKAGLYRE